MQTFLPFADFEKTAKCLDYQRLGKQRVEVKQILGSLYGVTTGWGNHPAKAQWENHKFALIQYGIFICNEWRNRGYKDNCLLDIVQFGGDEMVRMIEAHEAVEMPPWLHDERLHSSHRMALLQKDFSWYSKFGWHEVELARPGGGSYDYFWPSKCSDYGGEGTGYMPSKK